MSAPEGGQLTYLKGLEIPYGYKMRGEMNVKKSRHNKSTVTQFTSREMIIYNDDKADTQHIVCFVFYAISSFELK